MLWRKKRNELQIPPQADADAGSTEMARVWVAGGGLHCVLRVGGWQVALGQHGRPLDETRAWGILLCDLARHAARALAQRDGGPADEGLAKITETFLRELQDPGAEVFGEIVKP